MICDQHLKLFEAIKNKDPEAASREARMHIEFVENELKKIIGEESPLPQDIDSSWIIPQSEQEKAWKADNHLI